MFSIGLTPGSCIDHVKYYISYLRRCCKHLFCSQRIRNCHIVKKWGPSNFPNPPTCTWSVPPFQKPSFWLPYSIQKPYLLQSLFSPISWLIFFFIGVWWGMTKQHEKRRCWPLVVVDKAHRERKGGWGSGFLKRREFIRYMWVAWEYVMAHFLMMSQLIIGCCKADICSTSVNKMFSICIFLFASLNRGNKHET